MCPPLLQLCIEPTTKSSDTQKKNALERTMAGVSAVRAARVVAPVIVAVAEAATEATKERLAVADRENRLRIGLRWSAGGNGGELSTLSRTWVFFFTTLCRAAATCFSCSSPAFARKLSKPTTKEDVRMEDSICIRLHCTLWEPMPTRYPREACCPLRSSPKGFSRKRMGWNYRGFG